MINLMLLAVNEREQQILKMAFEQVKIKVMLSSPSYANYVKTLQYLPDIILVELPRIHAEQLHFSALLRKNGKTKRIPIIGYGNKTDELIKRSIIKNGVQVYIERPIKFSMMLNSVEKFLKTVNKSIQMSPKTPVQEKEADIKFILDPGTLPMKKIELMCKHISGIMAFPFTVTKVLHIAGNEKSGVSDLVKIIEADPVISANILKVANSVFFASLNRRITSIKDSIVRIGFKETKRVVMSITVMNAFEKNANNFGFNRLDFWQHQLAAGLASEQLSKKIGCTTTDDYFLAGLLHDFGIILLDEFFPTIFEKILEKATNEGIRFIESEKRLLSITHTDIVKELFVQWKLPNQIIEAAVNHYSVLNNKEMAFSHPDRKIILTTAIGNIIAKSFNFGSSTDHFIKHFPPWIHELLKLPPALGNRFQTEISHELDLYRQFLNIGHPFKVDTSDSRKVGFFVWKPEFFVPAQEYLKSQGHEVTVIQSHESYAEYHNKFDLVCAAAPDDLGEEQLENIVTIVKYNNGEQAPSTNDENLTFAPTVCIVGGTSRLLDMPIRKNLAFLTDEFDLRQLDELFSKLEQGISVTYPIRSSDTSEPTSYTTVANQTPVGTNDATVPG